MSGKIKVITGPMFSGKSTEIIRIAKRYEIADKTVFIFKPKIDNRYGNGSLIQTHDGQDFSAFIARSSKDIAKEYEVSGRFINLICIEEVQFFDEDIISLIYQMKKDGKTVVCAGLDMDWKGVPFHNVSQLLSLADEVVKLKAVCLNCGEDASHTYKKIKSEERIQVGGQNIYEPRCFDCWSTGR